MALLVPSESGSSLWAALGIPSTKAPLSVITFVQYVFPPVMCCFATAILAITPRVRVLSIACWPAVALLSLRAVVSVDMSLGGPERTSFCNLMLVIGMYSITARTLDWALTKETLMCRLSRPPSTSFQSIILDAMDLVGNLRGLGWNWSQGLYVARELRPANRVAFILYASVSFVVHACICDAFYRAIITFVPTSVDAITHRSSIFDESLPFLLRYFRSSIITIFTLFVVYSVIQMGYDIFTISAVAFLDQSPTQWPPIFEAPWLSTSLSEFWGRRWHQLFRRMFLFTGGYPLSLLLGRAGTIIGSFLASAVFHHIGLLSLNHKLESWWMLVGFGMMAPVILAERLFYRSTGRRVGGFIGWTWTMLWVILWGNVIAEGAARAGLFDSLRFVEGLVPVYLPVDHWATEFDRWLHIVE